MKKIAIPPLLVFALCLWAHTEALGSFSVVPKPWLGPQGLPVLDRPFALECIVLDPAPKSYRDLSVNWYRNYKLIKTNSYFILRFPHLTREDRGVYTCTASDGSALTTSIDSNELDIHVLLPPVVHIEPRTPDHVITASAGDNLTLTCNVTEALPWPHRYVWTYLPSPQGQLHPLEGRESTLTLGPLTREVRGQYFCQAWNDRGFEGEIPPGNASVTLDVRYLGNITLTPDLEVNEGDRVTLTCKVDCNPDARLAWSIGGEEVRHVIAKVDHYVIPSAACSDSQTYVCLASLPGLEINASTRVLVNCTRPEADAAVTRANTTALAASEVNGTSWIIALSCVLIIAVAVVIIIGFVAFKKAKEKKRHHTADDKGMEELQSMNSYA